MVSQHQRKPLFLLGENDGFLGTRDFVKPTADIDFDVKSGNLRSRTTERMVTWELIPFWNVGGENTWKYASLFVFGQDTPYRPVWTPFCFGLEKSAKPAFEGT